jgi:DNA-binding MarR family transcriptional regulator
MLTGLYGVIRKSGDYAYERVLGLSDFDWRVLSRTGASNGIALTQLVNELDRDKSQVGRSIKRPSSMGYCKSKRIGLSRNVSITLTDKGLEAYRELERLASERNHALIAGLTARELELLESLFEKFATNADKMLAKELSNIEDVRAVDKSEKKERSRTRRHSSPKKPSRKQSSAPFGAPPTRDEKHHNRRP